MSEPIPERADIRQLRIQAKELLRSLHSGDTVADGIQPANAKLADAQLLIARKYGFDSWPKLVDRIETPILVDQFKNALDQGETEAIERLLRTKPALRRRINEPMFSFDSPPIVAASRHPRAAELLPILVRYGADPNVRTGWWAGGFGALDGASGAAVDVLLNLGAKYDVWSAAAHGRIDVLRDLLDKDPASVNAQGGDGCAPLHFAGNAEVSEFLIGRGANLEQCDVDHEGTPIQYQINEPEVARVLLAHGARPDIFTAVALNDSELVRRILTDDPEAANSRVGEGEFVTKESNGGHIYAYRIGPTMTPYRLAAKRGYPEVSEILQESLLPARQLVAAVWSGDQHAVKAILSEHPGIGKEMGLDSRAITDAAQEGRADTVRLLLEAGLDPTTPGMDSGSALHVACWFGYVEVVQLLLDRVPLDLKDANHGSPPLGWATHGAQHCRNKAGDYVAVVETLLHAGADPNAPANSNGTTLLAQTGSREDVKAVLRKYGAKQ